MQKSKVTNWFLELPSGMIRQDLFHLVWKDSQGDLATVFMGLLDSSGDFKGIYGKMFKESRFLLRTVRSRVVHEVLLDLKRGDLRRKVMIRNDCADRVLLIVLRRAIITCFPHFWLPLRALAAEYSSSDLPCKIARIMCFNSSTKFLMVSHVI